MLVIIVDYFVTDKGASMSTFWSWLTAAILAAATAAAAFNARWNPPPVEPPTQNIVAPVPTQCFDNFVYGPQGSYYPEQVCAPAEQAPVAYP
jgi:hypothetical protein